jgi:hypothetical protein
MWNPGKREPFITHPCRDARQVHSLSADLWSPLDA